MYEMHLFCTLPCISLPAAGVFSALGCGARRGPACTLQSKIGPRPGSVARALGVQSCASWLCFTGLLSATPRRRAAADHGNPSFSAILLWCCSITPSHQLPSSVLCGSDGTTAVVHQAFLFVTATGGASMCVRVSHNSCRPRK